MGITDPAAKAAVDKVAALEEQLAANPVFQVGASACPSKSSLPMLMLSACCGLLPGERKPLTTMGAAFNQTKLA